METQAKLDFKVTMSNFQAGEFEFSFLFIWIFSFIHIICACSITRDGFLLFGDILGIKHDKTYIYICRQWIHQLLFLLFILKILLIYLTVLGLQYVNS